MFILYIFNETKIFIKNSGDEKTLDERRISRLNELSGVCVNNSKVFNRFAFILLFKK